MAKCAMCHKFHFSSSLNDNMLCDDCVLKLIAKREQARKLWHEKELARITKAEEEAEQFEHMSRKHLELLSKYEEPSLHSLCLQALIRQYPNAAITGVLPHDDYELLVYILGKPSYVAKYMPMEDKVTYTEYTPPEIPPEQPFVYNPPVFPKANSNNETILKWLSILIVCIVVFGLFVQLYLNSTAQ